MGKSKNKPRKRSVKSAAKRKYWEKRKNSVTLFYLNTEHSYSSANGINVSTFETKERNTTFDINSSAACSENQKGIEVNCDEECDIQESILDYESQAAFELERELNEVNMSQEALNEFSFISEEEYNRVLDHDLAVEKTIPNLRFHVDGHRIVDLNYVLQWSMSLHSNHSKTCTLGKLEVVDEVCTGLKSTIKFKCNLCDYETKESTHNPMKPIRSCINYKAVWSTLSTGGSYSKLKELLAVMGIPCMSYRLFQKIELEVGEAWKDNLWLSMEKAGQQEKELSIANGQIDNTGSPWITVFVDGGWSHRSYGHSYNASSGVAVIIGKATGKLLYLGVKNKYCCICARASNKNVMPHNHVCYKNWSGSSSAMEASIIVEGFQQSQNIHGIKYLQFIADGDSSVYAKIRKDVSYGNEVQKIECKNHAVKNYGKALYNIKKDTKIKPEARNLLTNVKIKELQSTCMKMIYVNAREQVEQLKQDLSNSPFHVFNDHKLCRQEYCKNVGDTENSTMIQVQTSGLYFHINSSLQRLISKGHQLVDNETNNRAELFMSILCKFNAGKRLNLTGRGSFGTRSVLSGLRYNEGVEWQIDQWRNILQHSPEKQLKVLLSQNNRALINKATRRLNFSGVVKKKKNVLKATPSTSKNYDYGPNAEQAILTSEEYESEKMRVLSSLKVTQTDVANIERQTVGQWSNSFYKYTRKSRLTASIFGLICKRKLNTSCQNIVKSILQPSSFDNEYTLYGKDKESVARSKFAATCPQVANVQECGIFIDPFNNHLAASPDGLVGKNGILEIKSLLKVHKSGLTLFEATQTLKDMPLEVVNNKLQLKRNHNYYYQVQGQLNIAQKDICFFIIYINDHQPLYIEAIERDTQFWNNILPKLNQFYLDCLLPKIIDKNRPCSNQFHKKV